tara:strand:- start:194 stop:358 length:165 start_codon:yes stop_codon:yes gene_type:complete
MKKNTNIANTFNVFSEKIKKARIYDWYAYDQTKKDLEIRKLIEYAKITDIKKTD